MKGILYRLIIFLILPLMVYGKSIYYYEPFSDSQATIEGRGWTFNFPMSRDMIIYDVYNDWGGAFADDNNYPKTNYVNGGLLKIMGTPNNIALFWNNWFCGSGVKFDPKSNSSIGKVDTSEEEPFGYTVVRYTTSLDARGNYAERTGTYIDAVNQNAYSTVWFAEDNGITKYSTNSRWDNFVFFYDKGRIQANNNIWGYFKEVEWDIPFSSLTADIDGNNPGTLTTYFQKTYDDQSQPHFNSEAGGYSNPVTDELAINLVHSGNKIIIYLNPNPAGDNGPQNTWIKFAEVPVGWSNDIIAFIGNETGFFRGEPAEANFDHFIIRTIASNVVASITPRKVLTNSTIQFSVEIEPQGVTADDSGIGEIYIKKPAGYGSWQLSTVSVSNTYGANLTRITSGTPGAGQFLVQDKGQELYIRFQMASSSANQIVRNGKILIKFDLQTPSNPDAAGKDFEVYVDCRKHSDTGIDWIFNNSTGIKYATTGRKKARVALTGDLNVKVYTSPVIYAYMQSAPMIVGQEAQNVTVRIDGSGISGSPDISYVRIELPSGFSVSNNDPALGLTNIVSTKVLLNKSISNIYLTNISGKNYIFINYMPNGFDGVYGFDMVNFNVYGTPNLPAGMFYSNFHWNIDVDSSAIINGTTWTKSDTADSYIRVVASNAQAVAYVTPNKVSINGDVNLNTNTYTYTFKNVGNSGNDIYGIRIFIPQSFDSVSDIVSSNGGSVAYSNNFIWVNYGTSPITSGNTAVITFKARHTNTDVYSGGESANFILYADNSNSMGYIEQREDSPKTWRVQITPPLPQGENKLEPAVVYTTHVTNEITNTIVNLSPRDISIKMLRIDFNTNYFTNILSVNSLLAGNTYSILTNDGNYSIYINYEASGTNLPSWYKDNNSVDKVVIRFIDKISYDTFPVMPTNVAIPTYLYKVSFETNDTNYFTLSTKKSDGSNVLYIEYPPVELASYISPTVIDTTTFTNNITINLTNTGMPGNRIHRIHIPIDSLVSTDISDLSITPNGAVASFNTSQNRIEIVFLTPFDGGESRTLTFKMVDLVENENRYNVPFLPSVSNDRGWENNITNGNSYISFLLPAPKGGGGAVPSVLFTGSGGSVITQTIDFYVTNIGLGSDSFYAVRIDLPSPLHGDLLTVYSTKLGVYNTNSTGIFTLTSSNITINYTNNKILAGQGDLLRFTFAVGEKSLPTNGVWRTYAHNGFVDTGTVPPTYFFEITNVNNWNRLCYLTKPIDYQISDNAYTTDLYKQFDITIKNGSTGNVPIKKIGINVPWPFTIENINSDVIVGGYPGNKSFVTNWLWIDYSTPLPENQTTILNIKGKKEIISDPTNVLWKVVYLYTNDLISYNYTNITGSNEMNIILPPLSFYAYVNPNNVSKDEENVLYTFVVANVSEFGNNIYRVKITPPDSNMVITNIQFVSGKIPSQISYSNDGSLYVDYYLAGTNISSSDYDEIVVRGYDNQIVEGFNGYWNVLAVNSKYLPANSSTKNPLEIGKSLELKFILPPYNSQYSILDKELDTLKKTNDLRITIANTGESGHNINALRIYLPEPFITNGITVSSLKGGILSGLYNDGTNYVEINYSADVFTNSVNDTITLKVLDELDVGERDVHIFIKVKYSTSGGNFVDSKWPGGDTNMISFRMPYPDLIADLSQNEVYNNQPNMKLTLRLSNNGLTYNDINRVDIRIPSEFTNNFDTSKVSDTFATTKTYSDGVLILSYETPIGSKGIDFVTLDLTNTITNIGSSFSFDITAYNGVRTANAIGSNTLYIRRGPAAYIKNSAIPSTYITNEIELEIDNGVASGNSAVMYAKVVVPDVFTNLTYAISTKGQIISNDLTNLVVYYENGLSKGERDNLRLGLVDKYQMIKTNGVKWEVYINNNTGYARVNETFSTLIQDLYIPKIDVVNLNGSQSFFTGIYTNTIIVFLSNRSIGENSAFSNVVELPVELRGLMSYSNTYPDSSINYDSVNGIVSIVYNNKFVSGGFDRIYLEVTNRIDIVKDFNYFVKSYNDSDDGPNIIQSLISFVSINEMAEVYLKPKNQVLYSIDNDGEIKLYVKNNMLDKGIKKIMIAIDTSILKVTNVYSTVLGHSLAFTNLPDLIVDYGTSQIGRLSADTLILSVTYTNTNNWTNTLTTKVMYEGGEEYFDTKVTTGESIDLPVLLADFGRVVGIVLPGSIKPQISIVGSDGKVVSNKNGEKAVGVANIDGTYKVDFVMPGTYRVQFSGSGYSVSNYIDGITVEANKITNIGLYKMKKAIFTPSAPYEQESLCLDDLGSVVIVPSGSLNDYFSLDIWLTNITVVSPAMKEAIDKSKTISKPAGNADNIRVYKFEMKGSSFDEREEQELKDEVIIKLKYNKSEVNSFGWNEDKLAVYYWRPVTKEWRRIGGVVDKNNSMVMFKAGYLHKYYAIMGDEAKGSTPGFVSVSVEPKIFTPTVGDRSFKNVKLSFSLEESVDKIEVKIYDLRGNLVKSYQLSGEYKNGEVYWDGKDFEGYPVKTGVYIYKILAGKNVYSGTVIIAK